MKDLSITGKYFPVMLLFIALGFSSCKSTKRVPDGQYLLRNNKVVVKNNRTVSADDIESYIYQKPNSTMIFGLRFYLGLYNLAGTDTTKWLNRKLQSWGTPPVIYDSLLTQNSLGNIEQYLRTQGFYHATVTDSVVLKKKKANVYYVVNPNEPYRIGKVSYDIPDTAIYNIIRADSVASGLRPRRRLSINMLDTERDRINDILRDEGYFNFNKGYITYEADTLKGGDMVDLKLSIANVPVVDSTGSRIATDHKKYKIKDVYIYADFDPVESYSDSTYLSRFDTIFTRNVYLLRQESTSIRPEVVPRANLIFPGMLYKESDVNQTYNNFSNLRIYKSVTIQFEELDEYDEEGYPLLKCIMQLSPLKTQAVKVDMEVSLSSPDLIGFSPGLHYGHRNLFKGAEQFALDFRGVFQYSLPGSSTRQNSFEYNVSSSISLPKFLAPIRIEYFKKQIPHTRFAASYTYQKRPYYTRSVASGSFGYLWSSSSVLSFILNPIDFNMVKMLSLNTDFYDSIKNPYLQNTYEDHFVLGLTASLIYTNQNQNAEFINRRYRRLSAYYFRINTDFGGNLLSLFNFAFKKNQEGDYFTIMNTQYSQYAKIDFNFTYNKPVQVNSNLVYRVVFGIGKPYGNSQALPYEKRFYAGGANSLRGWPIRGVGPGSAKDTLAIPNQVGDMRIEANLEYRFPLFWLFEGAAFVDAGNVWSISSKDLTPGATITSKFYKEIAMNTGLGLRLNLTYFIFRVDMGYRVHDPARDSGERFISPNRWFNSGNYAINIGVNYPF